MPLDVHGLEIKNMLCRKLVHALINTRRAGFWHMSGLTTKWKGNRPQSAEDLGFDPRLQATVADLVERGVWVIPEEMRHLLGAPIGK